MLFLWYVLETLKINLAVKICDKILCNFQQYSILYTYLFVFI
jgi:hypothetical protein